MRKSINFLIFFIILIFILLIFALASIYDLNISFTLADLNAGEYISYNFFAIFFEIFGEAFLYILTALSLGITYWFVFFKLKTLFKYLFQSIIFASMIGVNFLGLFRVFNYLEKYININLNYYFLIILIIFSIVFAFLIIFLLKFIKKQNINKLFWFAMLIILVAVFSNLTVQILKSKVFGRMRFSAMNFIGDFSFFTPWWKINGANLLNSLSSFNLPSDAFRSFPSGHVSASAILFCFNFLPKFMGKTIKFSEKILCYILPSVIVFLVGLSRIIAGAHFLTDVLFAVLINFTFIAIFMPYILILKQNSRKIKNKSRTVVI